MTIPYNEINYSMPDRTPGKFQTIPPCDFYQQLVIANQIACFYLESNETEKDLKMYML